MPPNTVRKKKADSILYREFGASKRLRMLSPEQLHLIKKIAIDKALMFEEDVRDIMLQNPILTPLLIDGEMEYDVAVRYFNQCLLKELSEFTIGRKYAKEFVSEITRGQRQKMSDVQKQKRLRRLRKQGLPV